MSRWGSTTNKGQPPSHSPNTPKIVQKVYGKSSHCHKAVCHLYSAMDELSSVTEFSIYIHEQDRITIQQPFYADPAKMPAAVQDDLNTPFADYSSDSNNKSLQLGKSSSR